MTGLFIGGAFLVGRAFVKHRGLRLEGGPSLRATAWVVAVVALVASSGVVVFGAARAFESMTLTQSVGSCWQYTPESDMFVLVRCSGPHDYVAVLRTTDIDGCPLSTEWSVERTAGGFLCLDPA